MPRCDITDFLLLAQDLPLFDVRTPAEFGKGHIPGANNLALFTDEERVTVGTLYKKQGRHPALLEGLDLVGPRMRTMIEEVEAIAGPPSPQNPILVHCWRGGMRSGAVSWLLELYGYTVHTLEGGYKRFRRWVLDTLETPYNLVILGGQTGSGKTLVLYEMERTGEQIIDLEGLANHKGSAFGSIGMPPQPTTQQFENLLAWSLSLLDAQALIWLEDESMMVGQCAITTSFWQQMKQAPTVVMNRPTPDRIQLLMQAYGTMDEEALVQSFERITRRLGGKDTKDAVQSVRQGDLKHACSIALRYYDKAYMYGLSQKDDEMCYTIDLPEGKDAKETAALLLHQIKPKLLTLTKEQKP